MCEGIICWNSLQHYSTPVGSVRAIAVIPDILDRSLGWNEWICTPFGIDTLCQAKITYFPENLIYVMTHHRFRKIFNGKS
jgi:hypothetical protein